MAFLKIDGGFVRGRKRASVRLGAQAFVFLLFWGGDGGGGASRLLPVCELPRD